MKIASFEHNECYSYHPGYAPSGGTKIYAWGSGEQDNAIPNAKSLRDKQGHIPFPVQISLNKQSNKAFKRTREEEVERKTVQICADTGTVFAVLDNHGAATVWGNPKFGFPECPTPLTSYKFKLLAVGENFVLGITREWQLMGWNLPTSSLKENSRRISSQSNNRTRSHDCLNMNEKTTFELVPEMAGKKVVDLAACGAFILAVVEEHPSIPSGDQQDKLRTKTQRRLYMRHIASPSSKGVSAYARFSACFSIVEELSHCNIKLISVGSTVRACVDDDNRLYTWGSNRNGALGHGKRSKKEVTTPTLVRLPPHFSSEIVSLDCTRGQPHPKNNFADPTGQEGPRIHLVTNDGSLWIAGSCHKGLGADHLGKVMNSAGDHLEFYRVGGNARDVPAGDTTSANQSIRKLCFTGCMDAIPSDEAQKYFSQRNNHIDSSSSHLMRDALVDCGIQGGATDSTSEDTQNNTCFYPTPVDTVAEEKQKLRTKYLSSTTITKSASAHIHSFALCSNGKLYGFGCGSDGRLGVPYFWKRNGSKRLMKCYVSTPSRVGPKIPEKSFRDEKVLAISVGRYWSFAIA